MTIHLLYFYANSGKENSMERGKNKKELKRKYVRKKSTDNLGPIENTSESEDPNSKGMAKNIPSWGGRENSSSSNVAHLFSVKDIRNFILDDPFLVRDSNGDSFPIYFDIENQIFDIENDYSFLSDLESSFSSYCNLTLRESSEDLDERESSEDLDEREDPPWKGLWVLCENCYELNYKKFLKAKMNICEQCGYHFKMNSSERIEILLDPGTWDPMDKDMVSLDPIEFDLEEADEDMVSLEDFMKFDSEEAPIDKDMVSLDPIEFDSEEAPIDETPYTDRIDSYQRETGLNEAVQTGVGQLNGIPIAIGVMDFQFMGGSMGSVVGEKITRLIEYATNQFLPLIIVCASGGARMQEGSLSLMQMAKISSALYDYQSNKKLLYVSILTSPTTGGVTASFGMLGDIIIAEPNSTIAFAGKRVIEQTLNITVPEGVQTAEYLFPQGSFDLIVPRTLLKNVLSELLKLHAFFPLNSNSIK
uniref:Acetyl-coenzyme A carboxylase carboxyl transferase subunit beta n=1 Tax=Centranthera grandiflora TaxID=2491184 RepID=A0A8A2XQK7_9LAMI|nr:acetyl-CoA carboxylase beta subunit [Centranthera grandiflora]QSX28402.1 acetyl-CoA carboxylase beta subunit [Centranthera grandiflora]